MWGVNKLGKGFSLLSLRYSSSMNYMIVRRFAIVLSEAVDSDLVSICEGGSPTISLPSP